MKQESKTRRRRNGGEQALRRMASSPKPVAPVRKPHACAPSPMTGGGAAGVCEAVAAERFYLHACTARECLRVARGEVSPLAVRLRDLARTWARMARIEYAIMKGRAAR